MIITGYNKKVGTKTAPALYNFFCMVQILIKFEMVRKLASVLSYSMNKSCLNCRTLWGKPIKPTS